MPQTPHISARSAKTVECYQGETSCPPAKTVRDQRRPTQKLLCLRVSDFEYSKRNIRQIGSVRRAQRLLLVPAGAQRRRRPRRIANYGPEELVTIFAQHAATAGYECPDTTLTKAHEHFRSIDRGRDFGNGRYARQLLDEAVTRQAGRLRTMAAPDVTALRTLLPDDIADVVGPAMGS